jgi:hypothetical protein
MKKQNTKGYIEVIQLALMLFSFTPFFESEYNLIPFAMRLDTAIVLMMTMFTHKSSAQYTMIVLIVLLNEAQILSINEDLLNLEEVISAFLSFCFSIFFIYYI